MAAQHYFPPPPYTHTNTPTHLAQLGTQLGCEIRDGHHVLHLTELSQVCITITIILSITV